VNDELGDHSLSRPQLPGDRLSAAFREHGSATGRDWTVTVRRRPIPEEDQDRADEVLCVRVDLTAGDADALADVLQEAAELAAGPGGRGANKPLVGSSEAAKLVGVEPSTIRAWVAGRGPTKHPFPRPVVQMRGRNLWRRRAVERWKAEQDAAENQATTPGDRSGP
jgi:hypothetical protein